MPPSVSVCLLLDNMKHVRILSQRCKKSTRMGSSKNGTEIVLPKIHFRKKWRLRLITLRACIAFQDQMCTGCYKSHVTKDANINIFWETLSPVYKNGSLVSCVICSLAASRTSREEARTGQSGFSGKSAGFTDLSRTNVSGFSGQKIRLFIG